MQASMQQSNIRQVLMKRIQMCEYALIEAGLFLDSLPDDQQALKYYSKHQQLLDQAKAEYVKQFGEDSLNRVILHDPNTKDKQEVQDTIDILKGAIAKNKPLEQVPEEMWKLIEF